MKKIILSFTIMVAVAGIIGITIKNTTALLTDSETTTGNSFFMGSIDLQVANNSYYNGQLTTASAWDETDLNGQLIFNFTGLQPGDWGADNIMLYVNGNDAWSCAQIAITANDENFTNKPEQKDGDLPDTADLWDGELANALNLVWWHDDGDNVLETGEQIMFAPAGQPMSFANLMDTKGTTINLTLADSSWNAFTNANTGPVTGSLDYFLATAWCFGEMELVALPQDNVYNARTPAGPNGLGITCDGSALNNITQTDKLTGNLSFTAAQSRHNPDYLCPEHLLLP